MVSLALPMSEPNPVPVLSSLPLDVPAPAEGDSGSTAQPTPTTISVPLPPTTPQVSITFLVISGRRRTMSFDPSSPIGRVKELVWLSWPSEWNDERPPSPNYLRMLYLGRLLQDDDVLGSIPNPLTPPAPASSASPAPATSTPPVSMIMHLSIRPAPPPGEENDVKKKRRRIGRSASTASGTPTGENVEGSGCCAGCVIC